MSNYRPHYSHWFDTPEHHHQTAGAKFYVLNPWRIRLTRRVNDHRQTPAKVVFAMKQKPKEIDFGKEEEAMLNSIKVLRAEL